MVSYRDEVILCKVTELKNLIVSKDREFGNMFSQENLSFIPFENTFWDIWHQTHVVINLSQLWTKLLMTIEANFITLSTN